MTFASFALVLAILFVVVLFLSAPLRVARGAEGGMRAELADLEAAREAKYREIRDADLDHRTGKLSDVDYREQVVPLRRAAAEAVKALEPRAQAARERVGSDHG